MKIKITLLSLCLFSFATLMAQPTFFIDTTVTPEQMVMDFFDNDCVTPSNVSYTGAVKARAFVQVTGTGMDADAGILLSSGNVLDAPGPNNSAATSTPNNTPGDTDLGLLSGFTTFDAAVLEFDIQSTTDTLCFYYIFASEEYPEYVNTGFNDVFAFIVTGPGGGQPVNIATVPDTTTPVTINTINDQINSQYYVDNTGGQFVEYDGYTTVLPAKFIVDPDSTYHVKLAISDASDAIFDSGVIIAVESLCGDSLLVPPSNFSVDINDSTVTVENLSRYATDFLWDFGDGTTTTEKDPAPHVYAESGIYDITLITENYCCSDTFTTTVEIGEVVNVNSVITEDLFTLSPNPFHDYIDINISENKPVRLELMDLQGRVIKSEKVTGSTRWMVGDLEAGVYWVRAISGEVSEVVKVVRE